MIKYFALKRIPARSGAPDEVPGVAFEACGEVAELGLL